MTSHSSHGVTPVTPVALHHPAQVAHVLGRSEWWVKEQARRRRIPFCRVGNSYRFTPEHLTEIIQLFEERPQLVTPPAADRPSVRGVHAPRLEEPGTRLKARTPRRVRRALQTPAAA